MDTSSAFNDECSALEYKCKAFIDAVTLVSRESDKFTTRMKKKYDKLIVELEDFVERLSNSDGKADVLLGFPMKLCSSTISEGVDVCIGKTRVLISINAAIQNLTNIIGHIYVHLCLNLADNEVKCYSELIREEMEKGEYYVALCDLFTIFENITKKEDVNEAVLVRMIQTILQLFSKKSPILHFVDIINRTFSIFNVLSSVRSPVVVSIINCGLKQLVSCIMSNCILNGKKICYGNLYSSEPLFNEMLIYQIITSSSDILQGKEGDLIANIDFETASEILYIACDSLPHGTLVKCQSLCKLLKDELFNCVKIMIGWRGSIHWGCLCLTTILSKHIYYVINHCKCIGGDDIDAIAKELLDMYEGLIGFGEIISCDIVNLNMGDEFGGDLYIICQWLQCYLRLLKSGELLYGYLTNLSSGLWFSILKFISQFLKKLPPITGPYILESDLRRSQSFKNEAHNQGKYSPQSSKEIIQSPPPTVFSSLQSLYTGIYDRSEYMSMPSEPLEHSFCSITYILRSLPLFSINVTGDSCAMDVANLTSGQLTRKRFDTTDTMSNTDLYVNMIGACIDCIFESGSLIYSLVVSSCRNTIYYIPYKILYLDAMNTHAEDLSVGDLVYRDVLSVLVDVLGDIMDKYNGRSVHISVLTLLQGLLIAAKLRSLDDVYERCIKRICKYGVLMNKVTVENFKNYPMNEFIVSFRCINSLIINFSEILTESAWCIIVNDILSMISIFLKFGVDFMIGTNDKFDCDITDDLTELAYVLERIVKGKILEHDNESVHRYFKAFGYRIVLLTLNRVDVQGSTSSEYIKNLDNWKRLYIDHVKGHLTNRQDLYHKRVDSDWMALLSVYITDLDPIVISDELLIDLYIKVSENIPYNLYESIFLFNSIIVTICSQDYVIEYILRKTTAIITELCITKYENSEIYIDVGFYTFYYLFKNYESSILDAIKTIVLADPQVIFKSTLVLEILNNATISATNNLNINSIAILTEIFGSIIENSLDVQDTNTSAKFVECLFMLANRTNINDNITFRIIGTILDFADLLARKEVGALVTDEEDKNKPQDSKIPLLWSKLFDGIREATISKHQSTRNCSIKSFSLFIKAHVNSFSIDLWRHCCTEVLNPIVLELNRRCELLVEVGNVGFDNYEYFESLIIACEEFCVAFKDAEPVRKGCCKDVIVSLLTGINSLIDRIIQHSVITKNVIKRELEHSLNSCTGVLTNLLLEYRAMESIWNKGLHILEKMFTCNCHTIRQSFYNVLTAIMADSYFDSLQTRQIINLALGNECPVFETHIEEKFIKHVLPCWIFLGHGNDEDDLTHVGVDCNSVAEENILEGLIKGVPDGVILKNSSEIELILRDKILNSMDILQEMQLLQLIVVYYVPNLSQTGVINKIMPLRFPAPGDNEICSINGKKKPFVPERKEGSKVTTVLNLVIDEDNKNKIIESMNTYLKEFVLFRVSNATTNYTMIFKGLKRVKNSNVLVQTVERLAHKFLNQCVDLSSINTSLQFVECISTMVVGHVSNFINESKSCFKDGILKLAPILFHTLSQFVKLNPINQVYILCYQTVIDISKYIYIGLYYDVHFNGDIDEVDTAKYWIYFIRAIEFFTNLKESLEVQGNVEGRLTRTTSENCNNERKELLKKKIKWMELTFPHRKERFTKKTSANRYSSPPTPSPSMLSSSALLNMVLIEYVSLLIVSPFSLTPRYACDYFVDLLDKFIGGDDVTLRRIALQRLSDATTYPYIAVPKDAEFEYFTYSSIQQRLSSTRRAFLYLEKRLKLLIESDAEIEILAALQIAENIVTPTSSIIFNADFIKAHQILKNGCNKPLLYQLLPLLFKCLDSNNQKIQRNAKNLITIFLKNIGANILEDVTDTSTQKTICPKDAQNYSVSQ